MLGKTFLVFLQLLTMLNLCECKINFPFQNVCTRNTNRNHLLIKSFKKHFCLAVAYISDFGQKFEWQVELYLALNFCSPFLRDLIESQISL